MKQIKLNSTLAGTNGVLNPGKHFVEDQLADDLVAGGYAEYIVIIEKAVVAPAEKAVVVPPEVSATKVETATVPSPWKK